MMYEGIQRLSIQMIPFLMAIVFHEVAHAFVARRFGDDTAEQLGRLTLNPVPHIDPIGTLLFPAINIFTGIPIMFGWARPVPIQYNRLKPFRKGLFFVAFAGPASNMIMAFFASFFIVLLYAVVPQDFYLHEPLMQMSIAAVSINYALALFNLIPLPPLDGSKIVEAFLSYEATRKFEQLQSYSFFILIALLWSGALQLLAVPIQMLAGLSILCWEKVFQHLGFLVHS